MFALSLSLCVCALLDSDIVVVVVVVIEAVFLRASLEYSTEILTDSLLAANRDAWRRIICSPM